MYIFPGDDTRPARISMRKPADMHQHFRHDWRLSIVAPLVAERFQMALAMPNLDPPITTLRQMLAHMGDINSIFQKKHSTCKVLVTLYLTDTLDVHEVEKACEFDNSFAGIKYYPGGKPGAEMTTGSSKGVADPRSLWTKNTTPYKVLRLLVKHGKVLLLHGADGFDKNGNELDPYDQERHFVRESLPRIRDAHPRLKISLEHISTIEAGEYVEQNGCETFGASLTYQHLALDRRDVFRGGYRPHRSWMPAIQPEEHREWLQRFIKRCARSHFKYVWLGSDSAPHSQTSKESACCANGVMMAHAAIELYAEAFDHLGELEYLEQFASYNGPDFFGFKTTPEEIVLVKKGWAVREPFVAYVPPVAGSSGVEKIIPFRLGEGIQWSIAHQ